MKNIYLITLLLLCSCTEQQPSKTDPSAAPTRKCFLAKNVKHVIDLKGTIIKSKGKRYRVKMDRILKDQPFMIKEGIRLKDQPDRKDPKKLVVTCQYDAYAPDKPDKIIGKIKVLGQKIAQKQN